MTQAGWVLLALAETSIPVMFAWATVLVLGELAGPVFAEHVRGGTPWHAHHIAERYGLMVIITLGEGLLGTMASLSAVVGPHGSGWSIDVALVGLAGVGVTFGMWWLYFVVPSGDILHVRRERSFGWGYGHIPLFGATVAVGAGLHVAAYRLENLSELGDVGTLLAVAIPLGIYVAVAFLLYLQLTRSADAFHLVVVLVSAVVLAAGVAMVAVGAPLTWSLMVVALTPWVTVVGYETVGHRHNEAVLARLQETPY